MLNFAIYNEFSMNNKFSNDLEIENCKLKISRTRGARSGQMAMSLIFLIGGIMIIIGATLTFVVVSFLNSTYGYRDSSQALSLAQSGVDDAFLQLTRNKDFSSAGYCVPDTGCGSGTATVSITQGSPVAGQATIISYASFNGRQRRVRAIAAVSSLGEIKLLSWEILQ